MEKLYILQKSKAKQRIEISLDLSMDPDGWFIKIDYIEKKTNKLKSTHCIIEKDLPHKLDILQRDGWIMENKNQL